MSAFEIGLGIAAGIMFLPVIMWAIMVCIMIVVGTIQHIYSMIANTLKNKI